MTVQPLKRCFLLKKHLYNTTLTWELLHAVGRAEVVFQGAVCVHGHVQEELGGEGEQRTCVVGVFDGANAHTQQPVNVQHLLLQTVQHERAAHASEAGGNTAEHLGVDGGINPGQSAAQVVQLLCEDLLALLELVQDVSTLKHTEWSHFLLPVSAVVHGSI